MSAVETVAAPVLQEPKATELRLHPLAKLLPAMSAEEYARLKADIKAHGVQLPILTLENQILDGRHRAQARRELGLGIRPWP
jgi:ParB-like chromosome segregation protein Spo0J